MTLHARCSQCGIDFWRCDAKSNPAVSGCKNPEHIFQWSLKDLECFGYSGFAGHHQTTNLLARVEVKEAPCQSCGACCVFHREGVDMYKDEADKPPSDLVQIRHQAAGIWSTKLKADNTCVALTGTLGESVSCSVYDIRPKLCSQYKPGTGYCEQARESLGLPPLKITLRS